MPSHINEARSSAFDGSSFKETPLQQARVVVLSFMQGLFGYAPVGCFRWNAEDDRTEIIIRDENPIHVDKYGGRPCINVTRGEARFYHLGIDDLHDYDFSIERKKKGLLVPSVFSINVCSRVDVESENLAWVVAEHIWLLRELLIKEGFFEIGRGISVSPPSPPGSVIHSDSSDEWVCCTVSVPWQFARLSQFTPLGRDVVQNICNQLRVNTPLKRVESLGWPSTGRERPYEVHECPPASFAPNASDVRGTPDPAGVKSNPLPKVPHPLNPAKQVVVRTVRPNRSGLRMSSAGRPPALPIGTLCVEKSESE